MVKKAKNTEEGVIIQESVEEVIKRIKANKKRTSQRLAAHDSKPDDMHVWIFQLPDSSYKHYRVLHEKCVEAGSKGFIDAGYNFLRERKLTEAGTTCDHCKEMLNKEVREQQVKENRDRLARRHAGYQEWVKEQVLLGKM